MSKIVVLNSGGFDSICLLHHVVNSIEKGNEVHSLHFTYGNLNHIRETRCVNKVCKKLSVENHNVKLPKFKWTTGNFYHGTYNVDTQYLEYRNLVFLSYAISLAESIGASKIYLAVLKSHTGYSDTSQDFLAKMNEVAKSSGIEIYAPFASCEKRDLVKYVMNYNIGKSEYFSCDVPLFKNFRCGFCNDCVALYEIEDIVEENVPIKRFISTGNVKDKKFIDLETKNTITEVRFLLNNQCQLCCKHCYYGSNGLVTEQLSNEKLYSALEESFKLGVNHVHFSGKEPLFDDNIFWYTEKINKHTGVTWSVVTNGINIPKFAQRLKEEKCERVFLSVDDVLNTNGVRTNHTTLRALQALSEVGIPVEIFIDLHNNNKGNIANIITTLFEQFPKVIKKFYVRTIKKIGNAEDFKYLSANDLDMVFDQMKGICNDKYELALNLGIEYVPIIQGSTLGEEIAEHDKYHSCTFGTNFEVYIEKFCSRYLAQVTLTPDGYLLGCASEVSRSDYDRISVGNIKGYSMKQLFSRGKQKLVSCQRNCEYTCSFLDENP